MDRRGWCAHCEEECGGRVVDFGIGVYEYGSSRERDVCLEEVSDCCEDEILKEAPDDN